MSENPWKVLSYPLMTEKAVGLVETENKLVFVVNRKATKKDVKEAFEKAFDTKVESVRVQIDQKGRKKAFIKLAEPGKAADVAMKMGMI
mgnify:CR=1 FL=1